MRFGFLTSDPVFPNIGVDRHDAILYLGNELEMDKNVTIIIYDTGSRGSEC
jgi:hypothetical protein